jgi:uncharacterized protein (UPF0332 family)
MAGTMPEDEDKPSEGFCWQDFLEFARQLAERDDEAAQRTAVSRSYYAVFHTAREVLGRLDPEFAPLRSGDSHRQVWDRLARLPQRQAKNAGRKCKSLLSARRAADYDHKARDWPRRCELALYEAEQAMASLRDLVASHA